MARRRLLITAVTSVSSLALAGAGLAGPAWAARRSGRCGQGRACSAGAHTLSPPGAHVYPETGNGGYTSLHTDVHLVYDATANKFLPGNHVVLTDRATQCLTSFSLDFERTSANTADGPGHDRQLGHGQRPRGRRSRSSSRPTRATRTGRTTPTRWPTRPRRTTRSAARTHNPLPPACSPELPDTDAAANSQNGTQCPANKLVITPTTADQGRRRCSP